MGKNSTLFVDDFRISQTEPTENYVACEAMPSDAVIKNILAYSKALEIKKSEAIGVIDVLRN